MRELHRSFYFARATEPTPRLPIARLRRLNAAGYFVMISVSYSDFSGNPFDHDTRRTQIDGNSRRAQAVARSTACRRARTDLYTTRRPGSTPCAACRLLGEQLARENLLLKQPSGGDTAPGKIAIYARYSFDNSATHRLRTSFAFAAFAPNMRAGPLLTATRTGRFPVRRCCAPVRKN